MTAQEIVVEIRDAKYPTQFYLSNSEAVALVEADRKAVVDRIVDGLRTEFFNPDSVVAKAFLEKVRGWGDDVA